MEQDISLAISLLALGVSMVALCIAYFKSPRLG
jgi:hypothetical protein